MLTLKTVTRYASMVLMFGRAIVTSWCAYMLVLWIIALFATHSTGSMGGM